MNTESDCYEYEGDEVFYTNPSTKGWYLYELCIRDHTQMWQVVRAYPPSISLPLSSVNTGFLSLMWVKSS